MSPFQAFYSEKLIAPIEMCCSARLRSAKDSFGD